LASCSDDNTVIIWELSTGENRTQFGQEPNLENWSSYFVFRGHGGDVEDLIWSPDGTKVASCSMDNVIIIWDITSKVMIKKLKGHEGIVKGISWDPIGRYIASAADDESLFIWRLADYSIEKKNYYTFH